jgi:dTDP-4-dehydrorhamnose 3,5-epimerase
MAFKLINTEFEGVRLIESTLHSDDRGNFSELFVLSDFLNLGLPIFQQDNVSISRKNVLRGLHYQVNSHVQEKLVFVLSGRILDVAVDLRFNSPNFLKYYSIELYDDNRKGIFISSGFAHGLLALEDSIVFYKATNKYNSICDRSIRWDDPTIGIQWPISNPILSDKDRFAPYWNEADIF